MYLLDTNVISEMRKAGDGRMDKNVAKWAANIVPDDCYISVVTVMEIELGILRIERRDSQQGNLLRKWFQDHVLPQFVTKTLPLTTEIAMRCAQLHVPNPQSERDAWIASTALEHGLVMVTRNIDDFIDSGVQLLNPWEY